MLGIGIGLTSRRGVSLAAIIRALFRSDEPGDIWINDDQTFYTDTAATTRVSEPGQIVAAWKGIIYGTLATQATAASRPAYGIMPEGGRRNELLATATLATQSVTVTAAERTLSFAGTGTVTLSGTSTAGPLVGTGTNDRVSLTFTPTAGTLTLTVSGSVTAAQLELGAVVTGIQTVTTALDVTEAGKRSVGYLSFDGVDDFLVTPTITPGTDKVQVFAGVRTAASITAIVAELSADANTNNGAFALFQVNDTFRMRSRGTVAVVAQGGNVAVPGSHVLAGLADIVGDNVVIRTNQTVLTNGADQGTGNYLAYQLYIGAKAGSSTFFNGHLYSLIARFGPSLDATQIGNAEKYVASNTPGVLL